jgi:hypothetical protein
VQRQAQHRRAAQQVPAQAPLGLGPGRRFARVGQRGEVERVRPHRRARLRDQPPGEPEVVQVRVRQQQGPHIAHGPADGVEQGRELAVVRGQPRVHEGQIGDSNTADCN